MGNHHSNQNEQHNNNSNTATDSTAHPQPSQPSMPLQHHSAPAPRGVKIFGCPEALVQDAEGVFPMDLYNELSSKIPPILSSLVPGSGGGAPKDWYLLFSSDLHGKSFSRLIASVTGRGPTIIIIRLSSTEKITTADGSRVPATAVIGGYNETSWAVVADREKQGRSHAAAVARADRLGHDAPEGRPSNQSTQYFGNDRCFVFRADTYKDAPTGSWKHENLRVFPSKRGSARQNYMYLADSHPDDSRIGIGMGGECGSWAWFVNRWLEEGSSNVSVEGEPIQRCGTFNTLVIAPTIEWTISDVDAYAVEPGMVAKLREERGDFTSAVMSSGKVGVLDRKDAGVDKMILELHNRHTFAEGREDV